MNYTKLTPDTKLAWVCPTCKNRDAGANISALIQEQLTIFEATLLPKIQDMITASIDRRIPVKLDALNELPELIKSIKFMSENYDKINKEVENLRSEVTDLRSKNTALDKQVSELSHKMAQVEQQARECNLELQCIPEHKNENLVKVAVQLGSIVSCPLEENNIMSCTRVAKTNRDSSRPKSVILKMSSPRLRDSLLAACVKFNKANPTDKLNSSHLGIGEKT
ncbi:hypothetical protein NE865_02365 [Phthorimaea operculella]|nr:hypothetical protein NE865_02365 [Phthorimaea operculella]